MASSHGKTATFPRIPYGAPCWPKADALLFAAAGFVAASAAPLSVAVLRSQDQYIFGHVYPSQVLVPALASGLVLAWKTLNSRTAAGAVGWALIGGPLAGAIAGLLTAFYLLAISYRNILLDDSALLGVPFGIGYGLLLAWLAGAAAHVRSRRAHDAFDRLLVLLGIWLIAIYGVTSVALEGQMLQIMACIGLMFGAAAVVTGGFRRLARVAWLRRVCGGRERNWTLREWQPVDGIDRLDPLFGAKALSCDAVLVHVGGTPGLPYRGADREIAVALAPGAKVRGRG
jgi:hypothetical protein